MTRDPLKSEEYFKNRYDKDNKRLNRALLNYETEKLKGKEDINLRVQHLNIVYKSIMKFYTAYSLGYSLKELKEDIILIIKHTLSSWIGDDYDDIEKAFELAIIFDIRNEEVNELINLLGKYNYKDKFLDMLANYLNSEWIIRADKLKFRKAIEPLVEVIELAKSDKKKSVERLKIYLERQWFNMQKEGLITNRDHLKEDKYRGYWCIESAALVKMLDLDDEVLKECKYYPYDLAHYI